MPDLHRILLPRASLNMTIENTVLYGGRIYQANQLGCLKHQSPSNVSKRGGRQGKERNQAEPGQKKNPRKRNGGRIFVTCRAQIIGAHDLAIPANRLDRVWRKCQSRSYFLLSSYRMKI